MLLQDRALELRCAAKPIEAINFTKIGLLRGRLDPVNGAIFAAGIGRVAPLVSPVTPIGCCSYSVVGLLVGMRRVNALAVGLAVQHGICLVSLVEASTATVLILRRPVAINVAVWSIVSHSIAIVAIILSRRRPLLSLRACQENKVSYLSSIRKEYVMREIVLPSGLH